MATSGGKALAQAAKSEKAQDEATEMELRRIAALDEQGAALETMKDEAIKWRLDFEQEWMVDYEQYNAAGRHSTAPTKREGAEPEKEPAYRQTSDNITRPKVIITASRLGDMLFPTSESNWALDPSPRPDIPEELIPPPQPAVDEQGVEQPPPERTPEELLEIKREIARKRCTGMFDTIKDQHAECNYSESGRAAIFDGCLYGTGVLRGPVLKNKRRHTFKGGGYNAEMVQAAKPTIEHVDLWSFFPQPSRCMEECEHAFRLHVLPPRGLRALAKQPGFDTAQIARLLAETPTHGALATAALERGCVRPDAQLVLSNRYSVWEYRGPMPKAAFASFVAGLVAQGMIDSGDAAGILKELEKDLLNEIDCEVWFSQGVVIKMALSTLAPGELGYYVFNYEKNPHSIFGHGVAYLCRDDQLATNQLWHAMMLNSMMSAGPQIGVRKGSLVEQPGGGRNNTLSADRPRTWALNDEVQDINKALSVFVIPNVTKDIMGMYERAKANADEHTMTPLIAQGEPTSAVPTSSGMAMLMNAANVVMRRLAKAWDDEITIPVITAFYEWNMDYNPDDTIKGDYCVIPKGASHLLIKDVQAQHLQFATQLFSTNPMLAPYMKAGVFARKNIEMLDISAAEMLYTDEQVAQNAAAQGEQPDPETIKAQAAMAVAEAQTARAAAEERMTQHRIEFERKDRELDHIEKMADIEGRIYIQNAQLEGQRLAIMQRMAQMDSNERIAFQKIIADLQKSGGALDATQYQTDMKGRLDAEKIASNERQMEREIEVEGKDVKVQ